MNVRVVKRDGKEVAFNEYRIKSAIEKGLASVNANSDANSERVLSKVLIALEDFNSNKVEIERIQDFVEDAFLDCGFVDAYKSFKRYRKNRAIARDHFTKGQHKLMKTIENFGSDKTFNEENKSAMNKMFKFGSTLSNSYAESYLLKDEVNKAHNEGIIHIHNLDFYPMGTTNSIQLPLDRLFKGGFSIGNTYLREPQSIESYTSLCVKAIEANSNDQHGSQSIPMFDYYMAEGVVKSFKKNYVKVLEDYCDFTGKLTDLEVVEISNNIKGLKDVVNPNIENLDIVYKKALALTDKETNQSMESLIHSLNTLNKNLSVSINFGTSLSVSGRMVSKNLILALENGLGDHSTPTNPTLIFKCKEGVNYNPTDPNYDLFKLAIRCNIKRNSPNFAFLDAPINVKGYKKINPETEVVYTEDHIRVVENIANPEHDGISSGRGNLSTTTINLPRLGIKHGLVKDGVADLEGFYEELYEVMDLVKYQLIDRLKFQKQKKTNDFGFLMGQHCWLGSEGLKDEDTLGDILKEGTLAIGFVGLAECLKALVGKQHGEDENAEKLGYEIVSKIANKCNQFSKETGLNFVCYGSNDNKFIALDKELFGEIEGITDIDSYTSSFHIPSSYNISTNERLMKESAFIELLNGGDASCVELDASSLNLEEIEKVVRLMRDSNIAYGVIKKK